MKVTARRPYTGNYLLDDQLELARRRAEKDGRLRFIYDYKIHLKGKQSNMIVMGADSWAAVEDGRWIRKLY